MNEFIEKLIGMLEEASHWEESIFDEDGYCNDDSEEVIYLHKAIEIVNKLAEEYMTCYKSCTECESYDNEKNYCPKWCEVIKNTVKEIEENHNGWIPCSERLPKITEEVLVTQFFEDSGHHNVTNASLILMLDGSGRVRWCCYDHFITHVIAWQPLPQPYHRRESMYDRGDKTHKKE